MEFSERLQIYKSNSLKNNREGKSDLIVQVQSFCLLTDSPISDTGWFAHVYFAHAQNPFAR
jgi:hypothetical protein